MIGLNIYYLFTYFKASSNDENWISSIIKYVILYIRIWYYIRKVYILDLILIRNKTMKNNDCRINTIKQIPYPPHSHLPHTHSHPYK